MCVCMRECTSLYGRNKSARVYVCSASKIAYMSFGHCVWHIVRMTVTNTAASAGVVVLPVSVGNNIDRTDVYIVFDTRNTHIPV